MLELPDYLREEEPLPGPSSVSMWMTKKRPSPLPRPDMTMTCGMPPYLLEMLGEAGICLGELEEQLMVGESHLRRTHRMQWAGGTRR